MAERPRQAASEPRPSERESLTRRGVLKGAAAATLAAAASGSAVVADSRQGASAAQAARRAAAHGGLQQAGIASPPQSHLCFGAFDLRPGTSAAQLRELLVAWSRASREMAAGRAVAGLAGPMARDTGEALGLGASSLTVTVGFGPSLFASVPQLSARRPRLLVRLPAFPRDQLDEAGSDGDLGVQVCADDATVAFHALHELANLAEGVAGLRWSQRGFSSSAGGSTPRNLMGFKDGTANPVLGSRTFSEVVWVQPADGPDWLVGGSYMVVRKVRIDLLKWDRASLAEQEATFGRFKVSGAPLTGGSEHSPPDLAARVPGPTKYPDVGGSFVIPTDAHLRRAHPASNGGARLFRRPYSYHDGVLGQGKGATLDAGLFFIAFARSPEQFIRIQRSLFILDHLNEYTTHVASALFAVPPDPGPGGYVGQGLLGA